MKSKVPLNKELQTFSLFLTLVVSNPSNALDLQPILQNVAISKSQLHAQQTSIDYWNGHLYLTYIAPGPDGDLDGINLRTVVSKGKPTSNGDWIWSSNVIEDRTIFDVWHTAPSIGLDKDGHIHVAYNMHNIPWQYMVSKSPEDISLFEFKGQEVSRQEIETLKVQNRTNFPTQGTASIPGNQITYPAFTRNLDDELFVTYRFAAKPAKPFRKRTMSSGIAKYNTQTKSWSAIGAPVPVSKSDYNLESFPWFHFGEARNPVAMAAKEGWTSYLPRLTFGPDNRANLNLFWREGTAGEILTKPCFIKTTDFITWTDMNEEEVTLPLTPDQCSNFGIGDESQFKTLGNSVADSAGNPYFILSPKNKIRQIYSLQNGSWKIEDSPYSAMRLFIDSEDSIWAVATGLKILRKKMNSTKWELMYENDDKQDCYPQVVLDSKKSKAYIYAISCDIKHLNVYRFDLLVTNSE